MISSETAIPVLTSNKILRAGRHLYLDLLKLSQSWDKNGILFQISLVTQSWNIIDLGSFYKLYKLSTPFALFVTGCMKFLLKNISFLSPAIEWIN